MNVKKAMKIAGAGCVAAGIVALSALVASGAAVGGVVEGFKEAQKAVKKVLAEKEPDVITEEVTQADIEAPEQAAEA